MYSSYTAASFARKHDLAERHGVNLEGALTWAFEFEDQPYFAGFRALATNGIDLPVLNVFRMFSRDGRPARGRARAPPRSRSTRSCDGRRARGARRRGPRQPRRRTGSRSWSGTTTTTTCPGPTPPWTWPSPACPRPCRRRRLTHYRIDENHSNAYAAWKRMGSPIAPTRQQYDELEAASRLAVLEEPRSASVTDGSLALTFALPRQAVSLVTIEWE